MAYNTGKVDFFNNGLFYYVKCIDLPFTPYIGFKSLSSFRRAFYLPLMLIGDQDNLRCQLSLFI